jgi:hypothetical protein
MEAVGFDREPKSGARTASDTLGVPHAAYVSAERCGQDDIHTFLEIFLFVIT